MANDNDIQPDDMPEDTQADGDAPDATPLTPDEIEVLKRKASEADDLKDKMLRMRAETENTRKRMERVMQERVAYAIEEFATELLPVSDNLTRAIQAAAEHDSVDKILEGVQLVEKQLFDAFKRHGVTPVEIHPGDAFDANVHEALSMVPMDGQAPNTIVQEVQRGFYINQRLLRPARVLVSAPKLEDPSA